mmetsp:Transcript_37234/g.86850  ORF Transcript_37234/g.86850 Transcript_37234/m.86850 type:complete len:281 (-) Transcript_37234:378-1220(-)
MKISQKFTVPPHDTSNKVNNDGQKIGALLNMNEEMNYDCDGVFDPSKKDSDLVGLAIVQQEEISDSGECADALNKDQKASASAPLNTLTTDNAADSSANSIHRNAKEILQTIRVNPTSNEICDEKVTNENMELTYLSSSEEEDDSDDDSSHSFRKMAGRPPLWRDSRSFSFSLKSSLNDPRSSHVRRRSWNSTSTTLPSPERQDIVSLADLSCLNQPSRFARSPSIPSLEPSSPRSDSFDSDSEYDDFDREVTLYNLKRRVSLLCASNISEKMHVFLTTI